jgi:hypothetical protein
MAKYRRKDPLAWGIVLIVLGLILLLGNIRVTRWDFWEFIARLWPLVLIAWGGWKLYFGLKESKEKGSSGQS